MRQIYNFKINYILQNVVKPYNKEDDDKKSQVSRMFNKIAPYYDFLNHFLSLGIDTLWRKRAIKQLADLQPKIILDVATGTADLALEANRQLKPEKIIGVDISVDMLVHKSRFLQIPLAYGNLGVF